MRRFARLLKGFVEHPWTKLSVGAILLASGLAEGWETFFKDMMAMEIEPRHGVALYGLFSVLRAVPEILEGLERIEDVEERRA